IIQTNILLDVHVQFLKDEEPFFKKFETAESLKCFHLDGDCRLGNKQIRGSPGKVEMLCGMVEHSELVKVDHGTEAL
ncbi:hypothetical protein LCGC14_2993040, partial [marine sediment metagenome]